MNDKLSAIEVLWAILGMHTKRGMCGQNDQECSGEGCSFSIQDWNSCEWRSPVSYWVKEKRRQKTQSSDTSAREVNDKK